MSGVIGRPGAVAIATALMLAASLIGVVGAAEKRGSRTKVFGHSVNGRALEVRRTGAKDAPVSVMVVGEIHGNETAGRAVVRRLRKERPPEAVELWTVLDVNPDGAARHTRQNADGVDLNRNFPRGWKGGGSPGDTYYPGPSPGSEPETRSAMRLVKRVRPDVTIWYHQAKNLVDLQRGADPDLVRRYADVANMPVATLHRLHGTATRWQDRTFRNDTAFVVELPPGPLSGEAVDRHSRAVIATGKLAGH